MQYTRPVSSVRSVSTSSQLQHQRRHGTRARLHRRTRARTQVRRRRFLTHLLVFFASVTYPPPSLAALIEFIYVRIVLAVDRRSMTFLRLRSNPNPNTERIRGSYDDALYKSTYTLLYFINPNRRQIRNFRFFAADFPVLL